MSVRLAEVLNFNSVLLLQEQCSQKRDLPALPHASSKEESMTITSDNMLLFFFSLFIFCYLCCSFQNELVNDYVYKNFVPQLL